MSSFRLYHMVSI